MQNWQQSNSVVSGVVCATFFLLLEGTSIGQEYPPDYKPSKPAASGISNNLKRAGAVADYMNDKLNAVGGQNSPLCYRNCLTTILNEVVECLELKNTYAASEPCERNGAQQMAACNPQCQEKKLEATSLRKKNLWPPTSFRCGL